MEKIEICEKLNVKYSGKYTKIAIKILAAFSTVKPNYVVGIVVPDKQTGLNIKKWILAAAEKLSIDIQPEDIQFCLPHERFFNISTKIYG